MLKSGLTICRKANSAYRKSQTYLRNVRAFSWPHSFPIISFTFDDFPRSAFLEGGRILEKYGRRGTFFVSLGRMGKESPHGELFSLADLSEVIAVGHEIGCHTFDHLIAWGTKPELFNSSIIRNREALRNLIPHYTFQTMAYPIAEPHPSIKKVAGEHFLCCRGGGGKNNRGRIDLNLLKSVFIDAKNREDLNLLKGLIDRNRRDNGWLIFSTHDISAEPSDCGCTPETFEEIVSYAVDSNSSILPIKDVLRCQLPESSGRV